ncbi:MAG: DUF1028 domain-containing protein [Planctomycetota bacterium]|nr:MAG: DUF1028 domain-containing protein [Planctomycetota bacterium]
MRAFSRPLALLLALLLLVAPAWATWSIVVVNTATGEVCVASATCLTGFNLKVWTPVLIPEVGGGAAQSFVDSVGTNRMLIYDQLLLGNDPQEILVLLSSDGLFQSRQYGIVDLAGRPVSFTGTNDGPWAGGVTGQVGTLVYAIQGNVLTCPSVVTDAELALISTPGDLSQKVMAAMEAAAAQGGDGRCSCDTIQPDRCGCVTTWPAARSAYVAYFLLSRPGDARGPCDATRGCAQGDYYLDINLPNRGAGGPEPIVEMRQRYDLWRAGQIDRPDALLSQVQASVPALPAGSGQIVTLKVDLSDVDATPLSSGGATVSIQHDARSSGQASVYQVIDNQDGTYEVELNSGAVPGVDRIRVIVDDGVRPVTLWPPVELRYTPPAQLPYDNPEPVPGLNAGRSDSQPFLLPDGLTAYLLSDRGLDHVRVMRATRASAGDPFGAAVDVPGLDIPGFAWSDLWVSADELRVVFSGTESGAGVERLYRSQRTSTALRFDAPLPVAELNSDLNDGGPWLSADELTLYFHSARDGGFDLWRAERLSPEAFWFPPVKLADLSGADDEQFPAPVDGGTRLLYALGAPGVPLGIHYGVLPAEGDFTSAGPLPGVMHALVTSEVAATVVGDELWYSSLQPSEADVVRARASASSLRASATQISVAAGGRVDFLLEAGVPFGGARYSLLAGGSGPTPGLAYNAAVLPLAFDAATVLSQRGLPELQNFSGNLNFAGRSFAALVIAAGSQIKAELLDRDYLFAFLASNSGHLFVSNSVSVRLLP